MGVIERVTDIVSPLLDDLGIELVDLQFNGGILRVSADTPTGIDMASIRAATKAISRAIDEHDPIPGKFTLEVSSPGLERPLRTPAHYERAVGSDVKIKLAPHVDGERRFAGVVASAGDTSFDLVINAGTAEAETHTISYDDVLKANTVFVWEKGEKASGGKRPNTGAKTTTNNVAPGSSRQADRKAATS